MKVINLIILAISLTVLAGCADENSKIRGEFLSGCIKGGAPKSLCNCVFEKLEDAYTPEELNRLASSYPNQPFMENVMAFGVQCRMQ